MSADFDWGYDDPDGYEDPDDVDEEWEDRTDDEDEDQQPYDDGDYDDDPWGPAKEEPDCYACNDGGCRACDPTLWDLRRRRLAAWWHRVRPRWPRRRAQPQADDPWEPPF